jgi:hypothetical protein
MCRCEVVHRISGEVLWYAEVWGRVWVQLAADGSSLHGPRLSVRVVSDTHPAAAQLARPLPTTTNSPKVDVSTAQLKPLAPPGPDLVEGAAGQGHAKVSNGAEVQDGRGTAAAQAVVELASTDDAVSKVADEGKDVVALCEAAAQRVLHSSMEDVVVRCGVLAAADAAASAQTWQRLAAKVARCEVKLAAGGWLFASIIMIQITQLVGAMM